MAIKDQMVFNEIFSVRTSFSSASLGRVSGPSAAAQRFTGLPLSNQSFTVSAFLEEEGARYKITAG